MPGRELTVQIYWVHRSGRQVVEHVYQHISIFIQKRDIFLGTLLFLKNIEAKEFWKNGFKKVLHTYDIKFPPKIGQFLQFIYIFLHKNGHDFWMGMTRKLKFGNVERLESALFNYFFSKNQGHIWGQHQDYFNISTEWNRFKFRPTTPLSFEI